MRECLTMVLIILNVMSNKMHVSQIQNGNTMYMLSLRIQSFNMSYEAS
jgi:hypothetical protein